MTTAYTDNEALVLEKRMRDARRGPDDPRRHRRLCPTDDVPPVVRTLHRLGWSIIAAFIILAAVAFASLGAAPAPKRVEPSRVVWVVVNINTPAGRIPLWFPIGTDHQVMAGGTGRYVPEAETIR